jgi:hypothetical protein
VPGVSFALHASYSADADLSKRQRYSVPNALGEKFVFGCRVLVGHTTCLGHECDNFPSSRDGRACDTAVDNVKRPITLHNAQVCPDLSLNPNPRP